MKFEPTFAAWTEPSPPVAQRWIIAGLLLLSGLIGSYVFQPDTLAFSLCIFAVFCLVVLLRVIFWRFSRHNAERYAAETAQVRDAWWQQHRRHVALQQSVLIGPAGVTPEQWRELMQGDMRKPEPVAVAGGQVLRFARTLNRNVKEREAFLGQTLALQWREQQQDPAVSPVACYWHGSLEGWHAFSTQARLSFPDLVLPEVPLRWNGTDTLDSVIDEIYCSAPDTLYLCAGCCVIEGPVEHEHAAGEAAVMWILGREGAVQLSRGEYFDEGQDSDVVAVATRAEQQSELDESPEVSFIFFHPRYPDIHKTGWNTQQHIQNGYWGDIGGLQSMVVQTLAAFYVKNTAQPCGWIAGDFSHSLALGIVKPYGKGQ